MSRASKDQKKTGNEATEVKLVTPLAQQSRSDTAEPGWMSLGLMRHLLYRVLGWPAILVGVCGQPIPYDRITTNVAFYHARNHQGRQ